MMKSFTIVMIFITFLIGLSFGDSGGEHRDFTTTATWLPTTFSNVLNAVMDGMYQALKALIDWSTCVSNNRQQHLIASEAVMDTLRVMVSCLRSPDARDHCGYKSPVVETQFIASEAAIHVESEISQALPFSRNQFAMIKYLPVTSSNPHTFYLWPISVNLVDDKLTPEHASPSYLLIFGSLLCLAIVATVITLVTIKKSAFFMDTCRNDGKFKSSIARAQAVWKSQQIVVQAAYTAFVQRYALPTPSLPPPATEIAVLTSSIGGPSQTLPTATPLPHAVPAVQVSTTPRTNQEPVSISTVDDLEVPTVVEESSVILNSEPEPFSLFMDKDSVEELEDTSSFNIDPKLLEGFIDDTTPTVVPIVSEDSTTEVDEPNGLFSSQLECSSSEEGSDEELHEVDPWLLTPFIFFDEEEPATSTSSAALPAMCEDLGKDALLNASVTPGTVPILSLPVCLQVPTPPSASLAEDDKYCDGDEVSCIIDYKMLESCLFLEENNEPFNLFEDAPGPSTPISLAEPVSQSAEGPSDDLIFADLVVIEPERKNPCANFHLFLDIDGTTVHSLRTFQQAKVGVDPDFSFDEQRSLMGTISYKRPGVDQFLEWCFANFASVSIWTAGQPSYALEVARNLAPAGRQFKFVMDRSTLTPHPTITTMVTKDMNVKWQSDENFKEAGITAENSLIIDDTYDAVIANLDNAILMKTWNVLKRDQAPPDTSFDTLREVFENTCAVDAKEMCKEALTHLEKP